ncbi:YARHG domain-containing protein [Soonwooa buanensis]|uniref:YARHG domain-containing protein n=1 Tax=Soonwooa buanensis TaxID=619805 RepID=A0A1T5FWL2_9FLAO|nr:YARHG domain-containing protein [Soonwooa buanensis]SKC00497.1 YARHG domain-containing protein [Soonwooa buanensis]
MKTNLIIGLAVLSFGLSSCKKDTEVKKDEAKKDSVVAVVEPEFHKELYGVYTGDFETVYNPNADNVEDNYMIKKLSVKINRITKDSVYGYSVVNGNQRPFRGIYNENTQKFILDEPGDDKTDGRFTIGLRKDSLVGDWKVFNREKVKFPEKIVRLLKKDFAYNPNFMLDRDHSDIVDWTTTKKGKGSYEDENGKTQTYDVEQQRYASDAIFKINASKQKLEEKDLKNMKKLDMEIIKNAVFARHGYSFKKETYRQFFDYQDWYIPVSNNVDNDLSPMEKENVALLSRMIKYAEDNYDSFGR